MGIVYRIANKEKRLFALLGNVIQKLVDRQIIGFGGNCDNALMHQSVRKLIELSLIGLNQRNSLFGGACTYYCKHTLRLLAADIDPVNGPSAFKQLHNCVTAYKKSFGRLFVINFFVISSIIFHRTFPYFIILNIIA